MYKFSSLIHSYIVLLSLPNANIPSHIYENSLQLSNTKAEGMGQPKNMPWSGQDTPENSNSSWDNSVEINVRLYSSYMFYHHLIVSQYLRWFFPFVRSLNHLVLLLLSSYHHEYIYIYIYSYLVTLSPGHSYIHCSFSTLHEKTEGSGS